MFYGVILPRINSWQSFFIVWLAIFISIVCVIVLFIGIAKNSRAKNSLQQCIDFLTTTPIGIMGGLFLFSAFITSIAIFIGIRHDYIAYTQQWLAILEGDDPWNLGKDIPRNAYGPLYNALALFYAIHPLAPKVLFCMAWIGTSAWLIKVLGKSHGKQPLIMLAVLLFLFINPFFFVTIAEHGIFDILPAICLLGALVYKNRQQLFLSGIILGLGILLKYYPIFLLPFLMINGRKIQLKPLLSCLVTVISGFIISYAIWGMSTFSPILFAGERVSKLISIFRFLRGKLSPLQLITNQPNLDEYSLIAIVLTVSFVIILTWFRNIEITLAGAIGMLTALTFYKVGHPQFYACLYFMIPFWYATSVLPETKQLKILLPSGILLIWIAILQLAYSISAIGTDKGVGFRVLPWGHLREIIGLPSFLLACWAILSAIYYGIGPRGKEQASSTAQDLGQYF